MNIYVNDDLLSLINSYKQEPTFSNDQLIIKGKVYRYCDEHFLNKIDNLHITDVTEEFILTADGYIDVYDNHPDEEIYPTKVKDFFLKLVSKQKNLYLQ